MGKVAHKVVRNGVSYISEPLNISYWGMHLEMYFKAHFPPTKYRYKRDKKTSPL